MIINVKDSTMVQPLDQEIARRRVWNSNLDLKVPSIHTLCVYFYKTNTTSNFFDVKIMKEALIKVFVLFYPMSGRFFFSDKDNRVKIDCDSYEVLFVEADIDSFVDDFRDFAPTMHSPTYSHCWLLERNRNVSPPSVAGVFQFFFI